MQKIHRIKLLVLLITLVGLALFLVTDNFANRTVHAYSSGPPAGFTHAPGEFDCAECHLPQPDAGTGQISIVAPQTYLPGQTYQITVTHTNTDPTRLRWGFQLTALDDSNSKAGNLQSLDVLTQVLDDQGPGANRQYIEHTSSGTFINQTGGASWTFSWTAPATNVGPVTFYVAGNQANNDGNTSGDYIYFTFAQVQAAPVTADFQVAAAPSSQTVAPGNGADYDLRLTSSGGFTGQVDLSATGLPTGANASFNPSQVQVTANPIVMSEPTSRRAIALESVTSRKEPFSLLMPVAFSTDTRNRIMFFVRNLALLPGEGANAVTADAEDGQNRHYALTVESVTPLPGFEWLSQVVVRLSDDIGDVGDVLVRFSLRGMSSSRVRVGIGHIGGGLPDDPATSNNSSRMTVTTSANTPVGTYPLTVTAHSGSIQRTATVSLRVASSTSADLVITKTGSPNPAALMVFRGGTSGK